MGACASKPKTVEGKAPQPEAPVQQTPKVAPDTTMSTDQVTGLTYIAMDAYICLFPFLDTKENNFVIDSIVDCG